MSQLSEFALHFNLTNEEIVYLLQLLKLNIDSSSETYNNNYYTGCSIIYFWIKEIKLGRTDFSNLPSYRRTGG